MTTMTGVSSLIPDITPDRVRPTIAEHMLADGYDLILDVTASRGVRLIDARDQTSYLDLFTFFASSALGMNPPQLADDPDFRAELAQVAVNKPSNSDIYTVPMARFVDAFARVLGDPALPHLFFIDGGGLAVENALKAAFDWKSRWNEAHGIDPALGTRVLHLQDAFHGRTGYTMSLTNTDPVKVARFPKFDWPRIPAPAINTTDDVAAAERASLNAARAAFAAYPNDIACFIAEPIQGEGGDNHFRPEYLQAMQALCRENDALFVMDEVQTGVGLTGTAWAYQQLGVQPDLVAFGKKAQVCGVMGGGRIDEVPDNVFRVSSRINSTWGGNLTDMVRARRILEVIESDGLIAHAAELGGYLLAQLAALDERHPMMSQIRGRGMMCAFTLPTGEIRDEVITRLRQEEHVLMLGCGTASLRVRPPLTISAGEIDEGISALDRVLSALA